MTLASTQTAVQRSVEAPNFDRLAKVYRWMELASFGPWLGRCRFAFLGEVSDSRRALVIGDGDGRFTGRLLALNRTLQVDAVDASPAMLRELERRAAPHTARLRTYRTDARSLRPAALLRDLPEVQAYDLIVTHFFLDCLTTEEVLELARTVRDAAAHQTKWLISEFALPEGRFRHPTAWLLVRFLYVAFGWLTGLRIRRLPDHHSALCQAGFALERHRVFLGGLLAAEVWECRESTPAERQNSLLNASWAVVPD